MPESTAPDAEQLMDDYFALRHGDQSKLDVLSESFTFVHPFGEIHGSDELLAMQRENEAAMTDLAFEVDDMLVDDDVVMWEWTMTGTHEGEWQGIPPTGREITIRGMSKTVIEDGQVQENRAYFDSEEFLAQLGITDEESESMDADAKKEAVRRYNEELFVGGTDLELAEELLTADYVRHARDGTVRGRDDFLAEFEESIRPFSDFDIRVTRLIAEGDLVCASWVFTGTNDEPLGDQPPTHRSVEVEGLSLYRFEGDRIAESWSFHDRLDMQEQLGLTDEEVAPGES